MFACHLYPCDDDFLSTWRGGRLPGLPPRPPRRDLVRRQRAPRRAQLVRGVAPNRDRYLVAYDRLNRTIEDRAHGGPRHPQLVALEPLPRPDVLRRHLARRHLRRHALLVGLARGPRLRALSRRPPALLLRVRLPVLHLAPGHPQLRRGGRPQHRLPGDGEPPEERRRQRPHRRDDVPLLPLPQGLRQLRLALPGPAGPRHQDRRRLLALAQAPLHGRPLLAAQRHLARRLLVLPRLRRQLEAPALHGETLLRPRHRLRHPRPTAASASPPSTTPPRPSPSPSPSAPPRWTAPPAPSRKPPPRSAPTPPRPSPPSPSTPSRKAKSSPSLDRLRRHRRRRRRSRPSAPRPSPSATRRSPSPPPSRTAA